MILKQDSIPTRKEWGKQEEGKKMYTHILHMCAGEGCMHVFSEYVLRATDTMKLEKTFECIGSGVEVSEALEHC